MKNHARLTVAALLLCGASATANAQRFAITKYTIDSGGGTSSGGTYSITGTIGQPDAAGVSTGGNYTVSGGYWAGLVNIVQTAGAPELTISKFGKSTVVLTWKDPDDRWALDQSGTLRKTDWRASTLTVLTQGGAKSVTLGLPRLATYFRLRKK